MQKVTSENKNLNGFRLKRLFDVTIQKLSDIKNAFLAVS